MSGEAAPASRDGGTAASPGSAPTGPAAARPVDRTRMTRRLAGIVLGFQAPVLVFGALMAWGLLGAQDAEHAGLYLWVGLGLAAACVVAAALLRRRAGMALGWLVQFATLATALFVRPMIVVGLIFGALWVVAVVQGRKMDDLTAAYVRRQGG